MVGFTARPKYVLLSQATLNHYKSARLLNRYQVVRIAEEVKILGERAIELRSTSLLISFSYRPAKVCLF
jgi:hypothetical protein